VPSPGLTEVNSIRKIVNKSVEGEDKLEEPIPFKNFSLQARKHSAHILEGLSAKISRSRLKPTYNRGNASPSHRGAMSVEGKLMISHEGKPPLPFLIKHPSMASSFKFHNLATF
jgi:hypothetical protein